MGNITLIRHGQANSHAKSEDEYDRLSELGHQQTQKLGEWFRTYETKFDAVYVGTLKRQQQSAQNIGFTPDVVDERLNEIAYYDLSDAMASFAPDIPRNSPDDFAVHFPATLSAWKANQIEGPETYIAFTTRIENLLTELKAREQNIVCVTSGVVIAQMISHVMSYNISQTSKTALPIWNSSIHTLTFNQHGAFVTQFNAVPHLDTSDKTMLTVY